MRLGCSLTHGAPRLTGLPETLHRAARGEYAALDAIIAGERHQQDTATDSAVVATCKQWPPIPGMAFLSGADLPRVPTLLLAGDHDLITPLAWTQHEAAHAPQGRLVIIPGAGHITQNKDNPPAGREAVTRFLTGS